MLNDFHGSFLNLMLSIRLALEVGAHRGRFNAHTLENQLWNRAFWYVALERLCLSDPLII